MPAVDLNADLGESFGRWVLGDDAAMLGLVSSANIACGFHAGDPVTLRRVCAAAAAARVSIGAHVGYRDLPGFGRRFIDVAPDELEADVLYQLAAADGIARAAGSRVRYLKPHGALYNATAAHAGQAAAVIAAVLAYDGELPVLGLPGSQLLRQARAAGLRAVPEAFPDRAYQPDGTLADRHATDAVLSDPDQIAGRAVRMVVGGEVVCIDGSVIEVHPESLCLHGDSPDAVGSARAVRDTLTDAGVAVGPFVAPC